MAANIEVGKRPVDCAGSITMQVGLLFARMTPAVTNLGEEIDDIEEDVLAGNVTALREQTASIRKRQLFLNAILRRNET